MALLQILWHFTDFIGFVVSIITSFSASVESADQCLLNSEILSYFSGVISIRWSFFQFSESIIYKITDSRFQ